MKNLFLLTAILLMFSCSEKVKKEDEPKITKKKPVIIKKEPIVIKKEPVKKIETKLKTGWENPDTYTVKVKAKNEKMARDAAIHRVLKDIVNTRMMNQDKFYDIRKIQSEFEKPLQRGKIIKKNTISGGIEIYFQIYDKGLKKKFEKK